MSKADYRGLMNRDTPRGNRKWGSRALPVYLFSYSGVITGTVLDDFSVRNLRGPFLLQRSRQTHPELTGGQKQSPTQFGCFLFFFDRLCAHLWPHAVRDATQHQRVETLGARQDGVDQVPGQVAHRVVVCELQVGLPAQSLLGVFPLR